MTDRDTVTVSYNEADAKTTRRVWFKMHGATKARRAAELEAESRRLQFANFATYAERTAAQQRVNELTAELNQLVQDSGARNLSEFDDLCRAALS